jgi:hypothetical protein
MLCDEVFGTPGTFARHEKRLRDPPFSSGFRPFSTCEVDERLARVCRGR